MDLCAPKNADDNSATNEGGQLRLTYSLTRFSCPMEAVPAFSTAVARFFNNFLSCTERFFGFRRSITIRTLERQDAAVFDLRLHL